MKKPYVKPEVYFESFELSACIATGCDTKINHAMGTCNKIPGIEGIIFATEASGCTWTASDKVDDNSSFCYHVPMDTKRIFTS